MIEMERERVPVQKRATAGSNQTHAAKTISVSIYPRGPGITRIKRLSMRFICMLPAKTIID